MKCFVNLTKSKKKKFKNCIKSNINLAGYSFLCNKNEKIILSIPVDSKQFNG